MDLGSRAVLVVDDDPDLRSEIRGRLKLSGFQVYEASNADEAQRLCEQHPFDLVITDVHMPGSSMDGLDLLRTIKSSHPLPVIVMTGMSGRDPRFFADAGADAFLPKPFADSDLMGAVARTLSGRAIQAQNPDDYYSIGIDEFLSGQTIRYDIYVKLAGSHYVRVARKGDCISIDRVTRYRYKGVSHLYIHREDFKDYLGFTLGISKVAKDRRLVPADKIKSLVTHATEVIGRYVANEEIDQECFEMAKVSLQNTITCAAADEDLNELITQLSSHDDLLYAQSLGVSIYALMMAKKLGWESHKLLTQVSLAGLFHDVGKKELPVELLTKPRNRMSAEDIRTYESHVARSVQILQDIDSVPEGVIQAVAQHHEDLTGTGYPNKLTHNHITPMGQLIAVADSFTKLVISPRNTARITSTEALARLRMLQKESLNSKYVDLLETCVQSKPAA